MPGERGKGMDAERGFPFLNFLSCVTLGKVKNLSELGFLSCQKKKKKEGLKISTLYFIVGINFLKGL